MNEKSPETWPDLLSGTDIPSKLAAVRELIPDLEQEQENYDTLARVDHVLRYLESELKARDPLLIPASALTNIDSDLATLQTRLSTWLNSRNPQHETQLTGALDTLLSRFAAIPVPRASATPDEEIVTLRRSVGQYRGQVERTIADSRERADTAASEFKTAAEAATQKQADLEAEIAALKDEIERIKNSAADQSNSTQSAFSESQTRREATFAEQLDSQRTKLTEEVAALVNKAETAVSTHTVTAEEKLGEIDALKARIEELVGIAGEEALVGRYSENAKSDHTAAHRWTVAAIALALVGVGIGIWMVIDSAAVGTDWDRFASRSVLVAAAAAVSAYAARQAAEHRHAHREAQHVALQLAALKPFLDDLDSDEDRNHVLRETALKIFGAPRRSVTRKDATPPTTMAQLSEAADLIKKLRSD